MDIRKYIKELLFFHDCVIIPGFGGFVTSYKASEIQRFKGAIYPPSKSILFNKRLQTNDGVLIAHISQREEVDYRTAEEKVRQFADAWNRLLDSKGMLMFPEIGKLYVNSSNALVFLPELRKNYLMDTFGLKPISYHLQSDSISLKEQKMATKKETTEEAAYSDANKAKRKSRWPVAAAVVALILLLLIPQMFLQNLLPEDFRVQQLDIMHFWQTEKPVATDTVKSEAENTAVQTTVDSSSTPDTTGEASIKETTESGNSNPEETTSNTTQQAISGSGNFYIIFGTADFISDAVRQKKSLDSQYGKTFEVFSAADSYVVGLKAGQSQQEAENSLTAYQSTNPDLKVIQREE